MITLPPFQAFSTKAGPPVLVNLPRVGPFTGQPVTPIADQVDDTSSSWGFFPSSQAAPLIFKDFLVESYVTSGVQDFVSCNYLWANKFTFSSGTIDSSGKFGETSADADYGGDGGYGAAGGGGGSTAFNLGVGTPLAGGAGSSDGVSSGSNGNTFGGVSRAGQGGESLGDADTGGRGGYGAGGDGGDIVGTGSGDLGRFYSSGGGGSGGGVIELVANKIVVTGTCYFNVDGGSFGFGFYDDIEPDGDSQPGVMEPAWDGESGEPGTVRIYARSYTGGLLALAGGGTLEFYRISGPEGSETVTPHANSAWTDVG